MFFVVYVAGHSGVYKWEGGEGGTYCDDSCDGADIFHVFVEFSYSFFLCFLSLYAEGVLCG